MDPQPWWLNMCFLNKYWCIYISLCLCIFFACFFLPFLVGISVAPPVFFASTCPRVARKKRLRRGWDHNHSGGLSCRQVRWWTVGAWFVLPSRGFGFKDFFLWNAKIMMIYDDYNVVHMFHVEDMKDHHFYNLGTFVSTVKWKPYLTLGHCFPWIAQWFERSSLAVTPKVILLTLVKPTQWAKHGQTIYLSSG